MKLVKYRRTHRKSWRTIFSIGFAAILSPVSLAQVQEDQGYVEQAERYLNFTERLSLGDVGEADVELLSQFPDVGDELGESVAQLREVISAKDLQSRDAAAGQLYAQLMLSDPDPDLLYGLLKKKIRGLQCESLDSDCFARRYWPWMFEAEAAVVAYEILGQRRFLDLVLDQYEFLLTLRGSEIGRKDEIRGRALAAWGSMMPDRSRAERVARFYTAELTTAGTVVLPLARALRAWQKSGNLSAVESERLDHLAATALEALNEFNDDFVPLPDHGGGVYRMPYENRVEPLNHSCIVGTAYLLLHQVTGDGHALNRASQLCRTLREASSILPSGAFSWGYRYEPENPVEQLGEPIWKGSITFRLPMLAQDLGVEFSEEDLQRMSRTFLREIWLGDHRFNKYVSDRGRKMPETLLEGTERYSYRNNGYGLLQWISLQHVDPEIRYLIESFVAHRPDVIDGWFGHSRGLLAYAERLKPGRRVEVVSDKALEVVPRSALRSYRLRLQKSEGDPEARRAILEAPAESTLLYGYLVTEFDHRFIDDIRLGRMDPSGWSDVAYLLGAAAAGFERTGEIRFARLFIQEFVRMSAIFYGFEGHQDLKTTLRWCLPALQFARFADGRDDASALFHDDVLRIVSIVEKLLSDSDQRDLVGGRRVSMLCVSLASIVYAHLGDLRDSPAHRNRANRLAAQFFAEVQTGEGGAAWWPARSGESTGSPIGEASEAALLPLAGAQLGLKISESSRAGAAEAFGRYVSLGDGRFSRLFTRDSSGGRLADVIRPKWASPREVYGLLSWAPAGSGDASVSALLQDAVIERSDLFPLGWIGDPRGALAYAYRLKQE